MLRSGDWLVPTENGLPFFHKPPLFYWITAASMKLFGVNAVGRPRRTAARRALTARQSLFVTLAALDRRRAVPVARGRPARDDALLLRRCAVREPRPAGRGLHRRCRSCLRARCRPVPARAASRTTAARASRPGLLAALGVLAKGLIGVVLPAAVILVWLVITGQARSVLRLLLAARHRGLPRDRGALVRRRCSSGIPGLRPLLLHLPAFRALRRQGFNNVQPFWFYRRAGAARDPALVAMADGLALASS